MQVSVETTGDLGRRITVAIPAAEVEKEIKQRLTRLAKTSRLPGFRPGRAPLRVIETKYGGQVLGEVAGALIEDSLQRALKEQELVPAGVPQVAPKKLQRGADLEYVADFEVFPQVKKADIEGVVIQRPESEITDQDIDKTLQKMRKQKRSWDEVERAAGDGDLLLIDFRGTIDGEPFPGGETEDYELVLGEEQLLPEFEAGLRGAAGSDSRRVEVTFPEDYQSAEVAGKTAVFDVSVKAVKQPVLPDLDEEFARSFGIEDGNLERMREEVRKNLEREMTERIRSLTRQRVLKALLDANDMALPRQLVEDEITRLIEAKKSELARMGLDVKEVEPDRERFEAEAGQRVALGLVLHDIVSQHQLRPSAEQLRERVEQMASGYEDPEAFVKWYYSNREQMAQLESSMTEDLVVDKLLQGAQVEQLRLSFDELMETSA